MSTDWGRILCLTVVEDDACCTECIETLHIVEERYEGPDTTILECELVSLFAYAVGLSTNHHNRVTSFILQGVLHISKN